MQSLRHNKKGIIDNFTNLITALGVFAIIAAVIFLIIAETRVVVLDQDPCGTPGHYYNASSGHCHRNSSDSGAWFSATFNATVETQQAAGDIPGWLPIVVVTLIGISLLGLVKLFRRA